MASDKKVDEKSGTGWPLVSISILSYNRKKELGITLSKVLNELDYPEEQLEIIVCDNASTDGTSEMLQNEFPTVRHLKMEVNIGTPAWNQGFGKGKGKYFLLLDDDAHIEGDTLKKAISFMEDHDDIGILSFNVIDPETRYSYTMHLPFGIFSFWGCDVVIRADMLKTIGGFDPNIFIYSHEPDFVIRAAKAGYKHHIMNDVIAYHRKDPSKYYDYNEFKCKNEHFSRHYTYFKHLHGVVYFRYLINALLRTLQGGLILTLRLKKVHVVMLKALFKAWKLGSKFKYKQDKKLENLIYANDQRCVPVGARLLRMPFSDTRSFYVRFFETRKAFYPDFQEQYFWRWLPYGESGDRR